MTPKEKGIELLKKYKSIDIEISSEYKGYGDGADYLLMDNEDAKKCALIAVDEILDVLNGEDFSRNAILFWSSVKQEIEKI
jgi:hypothetical protein